MKKTLLSFCVASFLCSSLMGQKLLPNAGSFFNKQTVEEKASSPLAKRFEKSLAKQNLKSTSAIAPDLILSGVSYWENLETGALTYYTKTEVTEKIDWSTFYKNVTVTILDNDFKDKSTITVEFPAQTNQYGIATSSNSDYFYVALQYFEGEVGPDTRKSEIWIVGYDGTVLKKLTNASLSFLVKDAFVVAYENDVEQTLTMTMYDSKTFEMINQVVKPAGLYGGIESSILYPVEVGGDAYLISSYHERPTMDDMFVPDLVGNNLILDFHNAKTFEVDKSIKIPADQYIDESLFTGHGYVMTQFGEFPISKWNVSTNLFNDDEVIDVVVAASYTVFDDRYRETNFTHYSVYNENSELVKKTDLGITKQLALPEIAGFDDEFAYVETDATGESIAVFNINKWSKAFSIPSVYNGEQLAYNLTRAKVGNQLEYPVQVGTISNEEGSYYGSINWFKADGEVSKKAKLYLGEEETTIFNPLLSENTTNPTLFNTDGDIEYVYYAQHPNYSSLTVAKADTKDYLLFLKSTDLGGNISGAGLLFNSGTNKFSHLFVGVLDYGVLLYDLPLKLDTGIESGVASKDGLKVYPNPATDYVVVGVAETDAPLTLEILDIQGKVCLNQQVENNTSVSIKNLQTGMYLYTVKTGDKVYKGKLIVK